MPQTIKILFLASDPTDAARLRLGKEARDIREQLRLATNRDMFNYEERFAVRVPDMTLAMLDINPTIVHFSGHGAGAGGLVVEDTQGKVQLFPTPALSMLFEEFTDTVKCVVLNACYAEEQAKAIVEHVDYVIGMKASVSDKAALAFSVGFYQALGAGRTVKRAFNLGKVQIAGHGIPDADIPVLYTRQGADTEKPILSSSPVSADPQKPDVPSGTVDEEKLTNFLTGLVPAALGQILLRLPETTGFVPDGGLHVERVEKLILFMRSTPGGLERLAKIVQQKYPDRGPFIS